MKALLAWILALGLSATPLIADTRKGADGVDTSPAAKSPDAPAAASTSVTAPAAARLDTTAKPASRSLEVEIEELRDLLLAQSKQFQTENEQLRSQLKEQQQKLLEFEERWKAANPASPSFNAAEMLSNSTGVNSSVASDNTTAAGFKTSNEIIKTPAAADQGDAKKGSEEGPSSIRFKGITLTPGGIIMAETAFRNHATGDDIQTQFTGIPYPNNALSRLTENEFSARQTRATLKADTTFGSTALTAYFEMDFNGTGVTSNNRQSNSYVFRQRQLWARATLENGFYVTGGQQWSLVTENRKGIENLAEQFPMQIDPQYLVGWAWQRAYGFRVGKNWSKFAVAADIEGPQTTFGGRGSNNNFLFNIPGAGGGLFNFVDTTGYTANKSPDFLFKAAADPGWGHYEIVGILSPFRDRVYPCGAQPLLTLATGLNPLCTGANPNVSVAGAFNDTRIGGGAGATARLPLIAKKLDFMAHVQGGDGIGRYSSAQLADVTARPDGTLAPIRGGAWLAELEAHPNPKFDFYLYAGEEIAARTAFTFVNPANTNTVGVGYGSPLFNNSGCTTEGFPVTGATNSSPTAPGSAGTCNGDVHTVFEGTIGFWHNMYSGPKGRFRWGIQYSYLIKTAFTGNAGTNEAVAGVSQRPTANDNMVFTSFRYYLP